MKKRKTTIILIGIATLLIAGTIFLLVYNRRKKYGNKETASQSIAGALSSAVTSGYVPESFPLRKGMYGECVRAMQAGLISGGYSVGSYGSDGKFGAATLAALQQKFNNPNKTELSEYDWVVWFQVYSTKKIA